MLGVRPSAATTLRLPRPSTSLALFLLAPAPLGVTGDVRAPDLLAAAGPDNRAPAARSRGNVPSVHLAIRMARSYPEANNGPSAEVAVLAEKGRQPSVPGPPIRVRTGTVIEATVSNLLTDSSVTIRGFQTRPALTADSVW